MRVTGPGLRSVAGYGSGVSSLAHGRVATIDDCKKFEAVSFFGEKAIEVVLFFWRQPR
jgi:hypothetical protein